MNLAKKLTDEIFAISYAWDSSWSSFGKKADGQPVDKRTDKVRSVKSVLFCHNAQQSVRITGILNKNRIFIQETINVSVYYDLQYNMSFTIWAFLPCICAYSVVGKLKKRSVLKNRSSFWVTWFCLSFIGSDSKTQHSLLFTIAKQYIHFSLYFPKMLLRLEAKNHLCSRRPSSSTINIKTFNHCWNENTHPNAFLPWKRKQLLFIVGNSINWETSSSFS